MTTKKPWLAPITKAQIAKAKESNNSKRVKRYRGIVNFGVDTTVPVCECERPWGANGECAKCGKPAPETEQL